MNQVRPEVFGFRDEGISNRHRKYGVSICACDEDFLLIEHNWGIPYAIVDYKMSPSYGKVDLNTPNMRAQATICTNSGIGFYLCYYWPDYGYGVVLEAGNYIAREVLSCERKAFTELGYVKFLHRLRGTVLEDSVKKVCNRTLPPVAKKKKKAA